MVITSIKTHRITRQDHNLYSILDTYLTEIKEKSVLAVTSKIVSICQKRLIRIEDIDRNELIYQEAEYYLPKEENKFQIHFTIKNNTLIASAGVDESNGNGYYILWPENPQKTANEIRRYLQSRFKLEYVGVIITDSKTTPMRWGVTGIAIAHSGFLAVKDYIGKKDLFERTFEYEQLSVRDCLASAAVLCMGEGAEQTPISIMEDIQNIEFQKRDPTQEELDAIKITVDTDLYGPFLRGTKWKKGKGH